MIEKPVKAVGEWNLHMKSETFAKNIVEDAGILQRASTFSKADSAVGYVGEIVVHNQSITTIDIKRNTVVSGNERVAQKHWPMCNPEYKPPLLDNQRRANHFRAPKSSPPTAVNPSMFGSGTTEVGEKTILSSSRKLG